MLRCALLCLALLTAAHAQTAAPGFPLGLDYSEWAPFPTAIQADGSGAAYILSPCTGGSCVTKLSADGKTILWQYSLGFAAGQIAVDPGGDVYVVPASPVSASPEISPVFIEKLNVDGSGVAWKTQIGTMESPAGRSPIALAIDATGRALVASNGPLNSSLYVGPYVVRLSAAGAVEATLLGLPGPPAAIAADPTGSQIVVAAPAATATGAYTFARLAPDGVTWVNIAVPKTVYGLGGLAVAPDGDAVILGDSYLDRIDPAGAVVFSNRVGFAEAPGGLALDAAGNAYVTAFYGGFLYPLKNSLAACGSTLLGVFAPDGSILQTTYLPGDATLPLVAVAADSAVFVLDVNVTDASFAPTQTGPFPKDKAIVAALLHLSPNANAQVFPLACIGNAATFIIGPVAPGEIVTLFGSGLGPQQGVQTQASLESPFPTQAGGVEVTFDGKPAPLLWVQDSQINAVVPWSVAGPTTEVCAAYDTVNTTCLTRPVAAVSPGVFTVDGFTAAALNQDGTVNSAANPAPAGSMVSIFATGLGPINPPQADGTLVGLPLPVNVFPVGLQWVEATCVGEGVILPSFCPTQSDTPAYAGPAPFLIAGASQINFNANDALSAPASLGLYLTVQTLSGGMSSNAFGIAVASQ